MTTGPGYARQLKLGLVMIGLLALFGISGGSAMAHESDQAMTLYPIQDGVRLEYGQPGCVVSVVARGHAIGSGLITDDGDFFISVQVAPGTSVTAVVAGDHECDAGEASTTIAAAQPEELAAQAALLPTSTGAGHSSNISLGILAAVGALGVGGSLIVASRRKRP